MINKLLICHSSGYDAHFNQAVEASLMSYVKRGVFVLYLWSNDNAVIIGKNQNAYLECDFKALERDNGKLARRITGGGAVYHDKGNVNFTFIGQRADYNEGRQFEIIKAALNNLGLETELTGRNDITLNGRKFSGNAFYKNEKLGLHHGTILIKSDYEKIGKYLLASKLKLSSNNVSSVAQRVINLTEVKPDINKELVFDSIIESSKSILLGESQLPKDEQIETINPNEIKNASFKKWHEFFLNKRRIMGDNVFYSARIEHRFNWGMADIRLSLEQNRIINVKIYSDTLDTELIEQKERALIGEDIYNVKSPDARDILELIKMETKRG